MLTAQDLQVTGGHLRIQDLKIAERLGFAQLYDIRKLIERNEERLSRRGLIFATVANNDGGRGRPGKEYWLTKWQAIKICMWSEAPNADLIQDEIADVFDAYTGGKLVPRGQAPITVDILGELIDKKNAPIHRELGAIRNDLSNVIQLVEKGRRDATLETVRIHGKVIWHHYYGRCPCNECENIIMKDGEFIDGAWHHHHQFDKNDNRPESMVPLAVECHKRIKDAVARTRFSADAWVQFQNLLKRMPHRQLRMDV